MPSYRTMIIPRTIITFHRLGLVIFLLAAIGGGCRKAPEPVIYELHGQIISIHSEENGLTIKHDEIKGFMPAMTMPFKVKDIGLIIGLAPGDFVRATLVVEKYEAYLSHLEKVGFAPLESASNPLGVPLLKIGDTVADSTFLDQDGRARRRHRVVDPDRHAERVLPQRQGIIGVELQVGQASACDDGKGDLDR